MSTTSKIVHVPHLGGTYASCVLSEPFDHSKPTVVCINSMCTTAALYRDQFEDAQVTKAMNVLAVEPLGHGKTISPQSETFTYWDSAIVALQVLQNLGIKKAFALGTSQGGWVVTRLALAGPTQIEGIVVLGTSMDSESEHSREKGCWNPAPLLSPFYEGWSTKEPTPDFEIEDQWCGMVASLGFGAAATESTVNYWIQTVKETYKGDEGRKKVRMALANLIERDSLHLRLRDIECPVLWLQGTEDTVFGVEYPKEEIKLFTGSASAHLEFIQGGSHYLNASKPKEVNAALVDFVTRYHAL